MKDKIEKLLRFLRSLSFIKIDSCSSFYQFNKNFYDNICQENRDGLMYESFSERIAEFMKENKDSCFLFCPVKKVKSFPERKSFKLQFYKIDLED